MDEVLTPDSSRFWDAAQWQPGTEAPSFDKQYVRDYLTNSGLKGKLDVRDPPSQIEERRDLWGPKGLLHAKYLVVNVGI